MAENEKQQRPVRKLTVKNFSVIKEAELEFGKITVLIGPQASGKSLLCKLAYFFGGEIPGIAVESLLDSNPWNDFLQTVIREFKKRFLANETDWLAGNTVIIFTSYEYQIEFHTVGTLLTSRIQCLFDKGFETLYNAIARNPTKKASRLDRSRAELRQNLFAEISLHLNRKRTQSETYIPSGRSLFSDASASILALQNPDIDPITKRFAGLIAWDTRWKVGYLTSGRGIIQGVEEGMNGIVGGKVNLKDGRPYFLSKDGRNLPLSVQSSGTLELLPMFNIVDQLACFQEHIHARTESAKISPLAEISEHKPLVYLEEPEAHIFPTAQYELIKLFSQLASDPILDFNWVITTHSPYILSVFGELVKAGKVGAENPKHREAAAKVIPEEYWINPANFRAYKLEDGKLKSIFDEKTGQIDGDYLDSVSGKISEELGQLLEIQYGT